MMERFCRNIDKVFQFGQQLQKLSDTRERPVIPVRAVFASAFTMFATARQSLNQLEKKLRLPVRLRGLIGPRLPNVDSIGRVYSRLDPKARLAEAEENWEVDGGKQKLDY
jgi:hypothetical protein